MRFILSLVLMMILPFTINADDRVKVQVCFKKAVWDCGVNEEITDMNMSGGNVYSYKCKDGKTTTANMQYTNCISYPLDTYTSANVGKDKTDKFNKWNADRKKPVVYVEPSKEDNLRLYNEHKKEAQKYLDGYKKKASKLDLDELDTGFTK